VPGMAPASRSPGAEYAAGMDLHPHASPFQVTKRAEKRWSQLLHGRSRDVARLMLRRVRARAQRRRAKGSGNGALREVSHQSIAKCCSHSERKRSRSDAADLEDTLSQLSEASTESAPSDVPAWESAAARACTPVRTARDPSPPCQDDAFVAIDCEMVGVGPRKNRSILARVAVLGEDGRVIIDEYVAATERVTDYRTRYSGIRARDLVGAPRFENVRQRVAAVLRGKILVGHAVQNDLKVLDLPHPPALIRDTSVYPGLRKELASVFDRCAPTHPTRHQLCLRLCVCASADGGRAGGRHDPSQAPSLKKLCEHVLGKRIQQGEHCPVEDAAHTLELYLRHRERWEAEILQGS